MKTLLTAIFVLAMASSAMALVCNDTETLYSEGGSFILKQSCDDGFDWRFSYVPSGTTNQQLFEMITGKTEKELVEEILNKSCIVFSHSTLTKDIFVCQ